MSSKTKTTATKEEARPALTPKLRFPEFREAGNWRATTVGNISDTVIAGGTPSTSEKSFWGGEIRWMNSGELNDKRVSEVQGRITREGLNNSSTKLIPPRCVLIGLAGQGKTRGTVAMNLVELCTNQSIAAIFPNDSAFSSDFLYHDLDKRYDELRRLSAGGEGRGGLNLQIIKSLKVAIPSLPEQQKIAECLSSVDDLMAAQARKVDALKTHKKGLMQQLFPREGETQPRLRFPEFQNAGEWVPKRLEDISHSVFDGTHQTPTYTPKGVPFYSVENLISGNANKFISRDDYLLATKKNRPEKGDILITRIGKIGYSQVVTWDHEFSVYVTLAVIKKSKAFNSHFLSYFMQSDFYQSELRTKSLPNAVPPKINLDSLRSTGVLLTNEDEQQRIASCLSSLDALITAETQKLEALKTHKKGLMQQLFPSRDEVEA